MLYEIMEYKEGTEASRHKDAPATAVISIEVVTSINIDTVKWGEFHPSDWLKGQLFLRLFDEDSRISDSDEDKIHEFVLKMIGEAERFLIHCGNDVPITSPFIIEIKKQIMNICNGAVELKRIGIEPHAVYNLNHWPDCAVRLMLLELDNPEYLPLLRERLINSKEEELFREDENVFMWAVSGKMVYEKLKLLSESEELVKNYIHKTTENGMTPLHFLCRNRNYNDPRALQLLVKMGVDINAQCKEGWTALHDCAYCGRTGYGQELFDLGALVYENDRRATPGDIERRHTDWPDVNEFFGDYEIGKERIPFPRNKQ